MEINRFDPRRPAYVQVADWIRGQIESGAIGPGEPIPSKRELRATFTDPQGQGISGGTVDKAVAILRDEGLVRTAWGLGIFVIPPAERGHGKT